MSSTVVCHNFISNSFGITETKTATLKLKVTNQENNDEINDGGFGNLAFLLHTGDDNDDDDVKHACYSHPPLTNPSFSTLSSKSLELCTENLGSETGSDIVTDGSSIFSCSPPLTPSSNSTAYSAFHDFDKETHAVSAIRSCNRIRETPRHFPPPLTTLTGSNSLRVHRRTTEDGRLIIEAVKTPFRNSYLQADRSDGRLRLCFVTAEPPCTSDEVEDDDDDDDIEEETGGQTAAADAPANESGSNKDELDEEIDREVEIEKSRRLSRCKDGSHGREGLCCNWKPPLWVATS